MKKILSAKNCPQTWFFEKKLELSRGALGHGLLKKLSKCKYFLSLKNFITAKKFQSEKIFLSAKFFLSVKKFLSAKIFLSAKKVDHKKN